MAWCSKSEAFEFNSLSDLNRVAFFLHAVNDHHGDNQKLGRKNQIIWYAPKLGEKYWMCDVYPVAILENKWFIIYINNI